MRVGERSTDKYGEVWVCTGIWENPEYTDYAMVNVKSGEDGGYREMKKPR